MALNTEIKILIVEDFPATRKMEAGALRQLGFSRIVEAGDGNEALSILDSEGDVGLIISDWNMPGMDGLTFLGRVRKDPNFRKIPFVMATAQAERREADRADEAGADGFIIKPFSPEEMEKVLTRVFEKTEPGTEDASENGKPAPEADASRPKTGARRARLRVGHIQITDHLVLGVLQQLIETGELKPRYFDLETRCMNGWNPVQKALEKGEVDGALILAPIAMDLFSYGVPIRMILFAHKNGSICVRSKRIDTRKTLRKSFKNKFFYIPHMLSVHHMLSNIFFSEIGLQAGLVGHEPADVTFEVLPPVRMPEFLYTSDEACGFMVAQPVGAKAVREGGADLLFLSGELWEEHPCCVVAMQESFLEESPDAAHEFAEMLVYAGQKIREFPESAAQTAVSFLDPRRELNLNAGILTEVLREPYGIKTDDLFPVLEDLDRIQRYMHEEMKIGTLIDLESFVDLQFAETACPKFQRQRRQSVFNDPAGVISKIMGRVSG